MISQTGGAPAPATRGLNSLMNVFKSAAVAAKDVFNFQDDPIDETPQIQKPSLFQNFSREIRMLQYTLGGVLSTQTQIQKELLNYALQLIEYSRRNNQENSQQNILHVKKIIGMMVFLAENNMHQLEDIVKTNEPINYEKLFQQFTTSLLAIRGLEAKLNKESQEITLIANTKHGNVPLQTEIAKIAVTTTSGLLNTAIMSDVMKEFNCAGEEDVYTYQQLIEDVSSNEELYKVFDAILGPENERSITYDLIRCILGLKSEETVSHAHAKQAILAAMMGMFCNRRYTSKEKLHHHMFQMLCFCSNLLRTEKGFTFDYIPDDSRLSVELVVNYDGIINGTSIHLWNHPAIQAIAKALHIRNLQEFWNEMSLNVFNSKDMSPAQINMYEAIGLMVNYATSKNPSLNTQADELCILGKLAFSSIHCNPLIDLTFGFMKQERAKLDDIIFDVAIRRIFHKNKSVEIETKGLSTDEAIQKLKSHGNAVANCPINDSMRKQLYSFVSWTMVPGRVSKDFDEIVDTYDEAMLKNFNEQPISVAEYAMKLVTLANDLDDDATLLTKYNNLKSMTAFLITKGLDQKLRDGLWDVALPIKIPHSPYTPLGVTFYLMHDLLSNQLVQIAVKNKRTQVEILDPLEWDQVNALV